ncbi:Rap guanine nucleotide exchange factor 1 [Blomia tropicalis]|nr:Rap guanine nucleotide exchange factor 1 [Blomia tropicalis]
MSLSSSASSNSSLCTNTSVTAATAEHMDKQQYLHLPFAPPPPTVQDDDENNDDEKDRPSLPPRLPPRRDKLNELPLAPPPPPPPVPSSVVIQQRMQQQRSSPTNSSGGSPELIPRTSTPTRQQPDGMKTRQPACMCHHCHYQHHGQSTNQTNKDSYMLAEEDEPLEETTPILMNDDEESMQSSSHEDEVEEEEERRREEEEEEEEEVIVIEEPEKPRCCPHCSDGTMHCEEECILSQTDVPLRLMTLKSSDDQDDDLGDLTIRAGTVDALIMKASQASTTGADATYLQTFLTTYRSFLSPEQLINKLIFRYTRFTIDSEHRTDIVRKAVAGKVVAFIVLVVNEFYLYDLSKSLAQTLMDFVYQLIGRGDLAHAKCLREKCYEKLRQRDREFAAMAAAQAKLTTYNVTIRTGTLLDFKSEHIAEQMTLLDSRLFHKIEIPEILIWAKEQKEELIPNLNRFTEHFNKMSFWTRSIILSCEEPKEREKCVMKFLKIMKHLRKLNNFNSYLAILSALGSAPISRLEWSKSIQETFKDYHALIDSSSSFRTYRTVLAMTKPPCIPYIGLILQDLTFVHIGNSDYLSDGKVNVAKQFKQFSILNQFKLFQQFKYTINENEPIITFFDNFDNYLQEEVMWQISESIKPRGGGGGGTVVST